MAMITVLSAVFLLVGERPVAGMLSGCLSADTVIVPTRLAYLKGLMSRSEADYSQVRDSLGLSRQNAEEVRLETDRSRCRSAVTALNAVLNTPGRDREIWLFALGDGWAVVDPDIPPVSGQSDPLFIFGIRFDYKATLYEF
jgi:hypothetical protein